jgi:hypothetical protein
MLPHQNEGQFLGELLYFVRTAKSSKPIFKLQSYSGYCKGENYMLKTLRGGRVRKIQSGELHHPPYYFSFKRVVLTISESVFSHNFIELNSACFLKNISVREPGKFSH